MKYINKIHRKHWTAFCWLYIYIYIYISFERNFCRCANCSSVATKLDSSTWCL